MFSVHDFHLCLWIAFINWLVHPQCGTQFSQTAGACTHDYLKSSQKFKITKCSSTFSSARPGCRNRTLLYPDATSSANSSTGVLTQFGGFIKLCSKFV